MLRTYRKPLSTCLCAFVALVLSASVALADAVKPVPWLAGVTDSSVYVSLEATTDWTDPATRATVDFGPTPGGYVSQAFTESTQVTDSGSDYYVHNIKLTGLLPNTEGYARSGCQRRLHLLDGPAGRNARPMGLCRRLPIEPRRA